MTEGSACFLSHPWLMLLLTSCSVTVFEMCLSRCLFKQETNMLFEVFNLRSLPSCASIMHFVATEDPVCTLKLFYITPLLMRIFLWPCSQLCSAFSKSSPNSILISELIISSVLVIDWLLFMYHNLYQIHSHYNHIFFVRKHFFFFNSNST